MDEDIELLEKKETKNKNFSMCPHWLVESDLWAELKVSVRAVLIVLQRYGDYTTGIGRPSVSTIAKKAGIHKGSVSSATKLLDKLGIIKKWHHQGRCYYQVYPTRDKIPEKAVAYLKETDKLPKHTVTYQRDKETGKFISKRRKKERNTVKDGVSSTVEDGEGSTVRDGDRNRDIEVETLSRDIKERKKEENASSFSLNSKSQGQRFAFKHSLKEISDETLRDLKDNQSIEGLTAYLLRIGYDEKEVKDRLQNL